MRGRTLSCVVAAGLLAPGAQAQEYALPPDTVSTVFTSDTVPGIGNVGGVTIDALGYVYVADFRNGVWRLSPDGRVEPWVDGLYGASGNAVGPRGELYQSSFNANTISRVERDGTVTMWVEEGLSGPVGIAVGPEGDLYVCNCTAGTIARVTPDREVSTFAEGPLFACPNGIAFDDRGDLYVVNFNNTHVVRITPDGEATSLVQLAGAGGNGHITFARGGFYVTKFRGHQVFRLERDGSYAPLAGTGPPGETDGEALAATFTQPNGIAASPSGKDLFVNDLVVRGGLGIGPSLVTLRRIRLVSLSDVLAAVPADAEPEAVEAAHRAYLAAKPAEDTTADAVAQAYAFLSGGRFAHGIAVFEVNAEQHPDDANSQYHLGEAYRYTSQPRRAAAQYEKALGIDPDHPQAAARLAEVRGGADGA